MKENVTGGEESSERLRDDVDLKLISGCVFTDLPLGDINTGIVIVATGKVADR